MDGLMYIDEWIGVYRWYVHIDEWMYGLMYERCMYVYIDGCMYVCVNVYTICMMDGWMDGLMYIDGMYV
jgi:hypothetical protein